MKRGWFQHPVFRFALLGGFAFLLGFSYNYHLPRIESFLLIEIERQSEKHSPVRVWAQKLHFSLFPLGVALEDVRILPKAPLNKFLAPARLKEAGARLSLLPLLRGDVRLSSVYVRDSELNVFLKPELFAKSDGKAARLDFEEIYRLPLDEISLERVQLQGRLEPQNVVFKVADLNLTVENRYRSLFVDLEAPSVAVKPAGPYPSLNAQIELRTLVEAQQVQISALKIKAADSFLVASGSFNGDTAAGRFDKGTFDARTKLDLSDLNQWERAFFLKPRIPSLKGRVEADVGVETRDAKGFKIQANLNTEAVQVDKYKVGKVQGKFASDLKTVTSDQFTVRNNAGAVRVSKVRLGLEGTPSFSAALSADNIEIRQLLENLGVHGVPIQLAVKGDVECSGAWNDKPELGCKGKLASPRFWVHTDPPVKKGDPPIHTIVEAQDMRIEGDVKVTLKDVQYRAEAQLGKFSKGRSSGTIGFEEGFKIAYEGDHFDFRDLKNLVNLKLEGDAKVRGTTEGTSKWATVDMTLEGQNLWLEDWPLGRANARMTYKAGKIDFTNVQGQYGTSQYAGQVGLDLRSDRIAINGVLPYADLHDLKELFQRKMQLPFDVSGTGQGQIEAHGPFRFSEMSYKVRSSFFRGEIARESFDEFAFNVTSKDGFVQTDRVTLSKSTGNAEAKGRITPTGEIDTVIVGRSMRLEQSENVLALGLDLQGLADFTVLIRGQLPRPRVELNGRLSRVVLADEPAQDSVFKLNFLSDRMEGSGQFLGSTLLADMTYPYGPDAPFLMKLKANKWDFTSVFSLVSKSARQMDFGTSVTGAVNLQAARGGFWASTGEVKIDEFSIRKGPKSMSSSKPMLLVARDGVVNSRDFAISSGESYLKLDVANLTRKDLNASLNGKLDLTLLGLFTPFISDLRGNMAVSMDLQGSADQPSLSGSAYIEKGYAKFADFPHPFANARADVLFNGNQVLINSFRCDMAGGKVAGDGKVTFNGKIRPVDVKASFNDVRVNVPEGFRTGGSGTVTITGNDFPYTMGIGYSITQGEVTYEPGETSDGPANVQASSYLPRFLNQDAFHPFTFNLDIVLKNPVAVNNSLANLQASGSLVATGTPDKLLLTGTLTPLPGGKVFFHDTPFEVSSAFVEYTGNPPANPKIFLTANTRAVELAQDEAQRTTEKQYDVNLIAQGRGPIPQIILSSQPPLSQREIVSLLTLGVTTGSAVDTRRSTTPRSSEADASNTSAAVGAALLQKAGGKRLKESFGVDFKVSSAQTALDTTSPKVTLSKQFTPNLGASASSTVQVNPANSVRLEYKLNKGVSVIGSWEGREYVHEQTAPALNVLGLDLEFKKQFK